MTWALPPPFPVPPARYMQVNAESLVVHVPFDQLKARCGETELRAQLLGCSIPATPTRRCVIILPTPETWPGTPATLELDQQHEQGHCNGWPANHPR